MTTHKSNRQRRAEIRDRRLKRAEAARQALSQPDVRWRDGGPLPAGAVRADREWLARHNNTYGLLPEFYVDRSFTCRDCGEEQVWTAKQQKWWYEEIRGHIDSRAVRCRPCRRARREGNPGGQLLRERCVRLRMLATRAPDAAARREIDEALASKWRGVRIVAIGTLGSWADAASVERLKGLVAVPPPRGQCWEREAQAAAAKALAACLPPSEAAWALEAGLGGAVGGHRLLDALGTQPRAFWERALEAEWRRDETDRLIGLVWALRGSACIEALDRSWRPKLAGHPDPRVARAVRHAWGERR